MGMTPLIELGFGILGKAEFLNPTGSIKDRLVKFALEKAVERGELRNGMKITEATSGNTGISLAYWSAKMGFTAKIFMPRNASIERRKMIELLGAELVLVDSKKEALAGAKSEKSAFFLDQFGSADNWKAHYHGTGFEIGRQAKRVDSFVAAIGTGGTLAGTAKRLREKWPHVKVIGVIARNKENKIEGIYPELPENGFWKEADRIARVGNAEAVNAARELIQKKGILCGISSGANYFAAKKYGKGVTITVLPDSWDRYFSTRLFENN